MSSGVVTGTAVTMPQLGETVAEGTVIRWLKSVGDIVVLDEPLLEVSTDKVDTEVGAPASGLLAEILVAEDETVPVGTVIARIGGSPASTAATSTPGAQLVQEPSADEASGSRRAGTNVLLSDAAVPRASSRHHATPLVRRIAGEKEVFFGRRRRVGAGGTHHSL